MSRVSLARRPAPFPSCSWGARVLRATALALGLVCPLVSWGESEESEAPEVQTMDLASVRGSWIETTRSDGAARALHFEESCVVMEQLLDAEAQESAFIRTCTRQCMPLGICAYLFQSEEGVTQRSLVLGGWVVDDGRMRMFGTLYVHGLEGEIVDGLPVAFVPPETD